MFILFACGEERTVKMQRSVVAYGQVYKLRDVQETTEVDARIAHSPLSLYLKHSSKAPTRKIWKSKRGVQVYDCDFQG